MNCSNERLNNVKFNFNVGFFFGFAIVMELLSSLLRIVLGILSVNIKMFQMTFDGREVSLKDLVPGTTRSHKKSVCL